MQRLHGLMQLLLAPCGEGETAESSGPTLSKLLCMTLHTETLALLVVEYVLGLEGYIPSTMSPHLAILLVTPIT